MPTGRKMILIDEHVIYDGLSSDEAVRKEYRKFVKEMLQKNEAMRGEMEKRLIYGGSELSIG